MAGSAAPSTPVANPNRRLESKSECFIGRSRITSHSRRTGKILPRNRHEIRVLDPLTEQLGRRQPAELAKVMNEMRLVIVTAPGGHVRPQHRPAPGDLPERALETAHAAKTLRRQADFFRKYLNEPARAQAQF